MNAIRILNEISIRTAARITSQVTNPVFQWNPRRNPRQNKNRWLWRCIGAGVVGFLSFAISLRDASAQVADSEREKIFTEVRALYEPEAQAQNQIFVIETRPASPLVSASAESDGRLLRVVLDGGLLRSPRLTADGLRLTICHEIGHIFGGSPRRALPLDWSGPMAPDGLSLLSSEGQADYYSSLVCFRHLVAGQDHEEVIIKNSLERITPRLARLCDESWGERTEEAFVCRRAALGGENLLRLVRDFSISFETPDMSVASSLIRDTYPSRQCRLDTVLAGALCRNPLPLRLHPDVAEQSQCRGQPEGMRPRCWYPD